MATINSLRKKLNAVDAKILVLLEKRVALVSQVRECKGEQGISFINRARERELIHTAQKNSSLSEESVEKLLRTVLQISKKELKNL